MKNADPGISVLAKNCVRSRPVYHDGIRLKSSDNMFQPSGKELTIMQEFYATVGPNRNGSMFRDSGTADISPPCAYSKFGTVSWSFLRPENQTVWQKIPPIGDYAEVHFEH